MNSHYHPSNVVCDILNHPNSLWKFQLFFAHLVLYYTISSYKLIFVHTVLATLNDSYNTVMELIDKKIQLGGEGML